MRWATMDLGIARVRKARRRARFWRDVRAVTVTLAVMSLLPATLLGGGTTLLAGYGAWKAHGRVKANVQESWLWAGA